MTMSIWNVNLCISYRSAYVGFNPDCFDRQDSRHGRIKTKTLTRTDPTAPICRTVELSPRRCRVSLEEHPQEHHYGIADLMHVLHRLLHMHRDDSSISYDHCSQLLWLVVSPRYHNTTFEMAASYGKLTPKRQKRRQCSSRSHARRREPPRRKFGI